MVRGDVLIAARHVVILCVVDEFAPTASTDPDTFLGAVRGSQNHEWLFTAVRICGINQLATQTDPMKP